MKQIPNLFTLLNLFFGALAIIFILQPGETLASVYNQQVIINLPENIWWGAVFIGIAAVIDFLDGFVARLFKATSEMGKQLDSLADVVSFGVAPGMIMYQMLRMSFLREEGGIDTSMVFLLPALLLPCAAAYRLARFNIDPTQSHDFKGVPAPAAGLVVASFPLILFYDYFEINSLLLNKWVIYVLILLISWLMVSSLRMMGLKFRNPGLRNNLPQVLLAVLGIIAALFLQWLAVPVVFFIYIILSLTLHRTEK